MSSEIRHTLPRAQRLKLKRSINQLFSEGKGGFVYPIRYVLYATPLGEETPCDELPSEADESDVSDELTINASETTPKHTFEGEGIEAEAQILVSVSKRLHKRANARNQLKRRMREAYRLQKEPLRELARSRNEQIHLALIYTTADKLDYNVISSAVGRIIQRITNQSQSADQGQTADPRQTATE